LKRELKLIAHNKVSERNIIYQHKHAIYFGLKSLRWFWQIPWHRGYKSEIVVQIPRWLKKWTNFIWNMKIMKNTLAMHTVTIQDTYIRCNYDKNKTYTDSIQPHN